MSDDSARTHDVYQVSWTDRSRKLNPSARRATKGVEVVYYVRMQDGTVKIGTSADFLSRIRRHGLPGMRGKDRVLAIEFGGRALERKRHQQFAHLRIGKTERFRIGADLIDHIKSIRAETGIAS